MRKVKLLLVASLLGLLCLYVYDFVVINEERFSWERPRFLDPNPQIWDAMTFIAVVLVLIIAYEEVDKRGYWE